jgi:type IV pilus assembly protein PilM
MPMPSLSALKSNFNISLPLGRGGGSVVGLDVQPGYVAAVQAHVNGGIVVERAAGAALPPDVMREGEVLDEQELAVALRELFHDGRLGKRVRVGLANQRSVLRMLELPPVTDRKELDAAVRFQAEDQVPMPLAGAVLDYHSLGVFETPNGPRQRVIVVAAQREMVERMLRAVRHAGLRAEGIDLSAFALIRSLYRASGAAAPSELSQSGGGEAAPERVLYLNVGGLTNMAIAEGTLCRFTRVVGGGLEAMASEIAERRGIPLLQARALLAEFELPRPVEAPRVEAPSVEAPNVEALSVEPPVGVPELPDPETVEMWELAQAPVAAPEPAPAAPESVPSAPEPVLSAPEPVPSVDPEVRMVLENGIREIVGDVRNSLDFHRSQDGGGEVTSIVLSGPALEIAGFSHALEADLGIQVHRESVHLADDAALGELSPNYLAIAAGLAAEEVQP